MKLAQSSLPTLYRHTVTTSKVDRTLCEQRAQTMQQLLRGMARVWDVSVLEERGTSTLRHFLSSGSDVEKRTPESAWYTAAGGWPTAMVQAAAPRSLVPHAGEAPALHPPLASAIGEVRIEVLEAVGLLQATRPTAALLDLRSEVAFDEMHLQGAASFSLSTLPHRTAELPPSSSAGLHLLGASVAELAHARHFLNEQVC
jgi:hypothetical protein